MAFTPDPQVLTFTPTDPTGQTSATYVMMGLGSTVTITPNTTGRVLVICTGMMGNSGAAGDGTTIQLSQGTGSAPANNASVTGTQFGSTTKAFVASTTAGFQGFALSWLITGLVIGTAAWIDIALKTVTGGPGSVKGCDFVLIEL